MRQAVLTVAVLIVLGIGARASTLFRSDPWEYWTDYSDYATGKRAG